MSFAPLDWLSTLLAALLLCGCGQPPAGSRVSGQVTFQGKPLDQGMIVFSPVDGQATLSGCPIKDGRYNVPPENGLAPGKYDVRITSSEGIAPADPLEMGIFTERIPPQYNSQTTLTAEVKESGENIAAGW